MSTWRLVAARLGPRRPSLACITFLWIVFSSTSLANSFFCSDSILKPSKQFRLFWFTQPSLPPKPFDHLTIWIAVRNDKRRMIRIVEMWHNNWSIFQHGDAIPVLPYVGGNPFCREKGPQKMRCRGIGENEGFSPISRKISLFVGETEQSSAKL